MCVCNKCDTDKLKLHHYNRTVSENNKNKLVEEEEKKRQINMSSVICDFIK